MIPRSLKSRLTLQQQGMAVLVIAAFAASAMWITGATLSREEAQTVRTAATSIAASLDLEFAEDHDLAKSIETVLREEAVEGVHITIKDSQGRVLATSPAQRAAGSAIRSGEFHPAHAVAKCGAWVEVAMSDRLSRASLAALARALVIAALPLLLITFALSRWTVRRALQPLREMTERAGAISMNDGAQGLGGASGLEELEQLRLAFDRVLGRLNDQLRAERQFASDASHELRTPLTVLSGEIELARQGSLDTKSIESLEHAAEQARSMRELVEALMLLRRSSEGPVLVRQAFEPVDLSDVVETAVREVGVRHPERRDDIGVRADLDVMVSGHPVLLVAGVRNLLDNAIKFTSTDIQVRVTVAQDERSASVCVEDGGRGIDASDHERIFDPFFRGTEARAASTGFGLGLPILRRVARAHGGDVAVERSPLGGAQITLQLPRWHPGSAA